MNFKKVKNYQDTIIFVFQIIILEAIILFIKLVSVKWDFAQIQWDSFILMVALTIYAKFIGTQFATKRNLLNPDIITRETQIKDLFVSLLNSGKITEFNKVLYYKGELEKIQNLLKKQSIINQKLQKKKIATLSKAKQDEQLDFLVNYNNQKYEALLTMLNLLKNNKYDDYEDFKTSEETTKKIDVSKVKYKYLSSSNLFINHKKSSNSNESDFDKSSFSQFKSSMSYNLPFYVITLMMSYILSCFNGINQKDTTQTIIDAISLTLNVGNGIFSGFLNGGKIINEDYKTVLDERIKIITETYNKIGTLEKASFNG